jgi:hypothetical protein
VNEARRALKAAIGEAIGGDAESQRKLAKILDKAARKIRALNEGREPEVDL